MVIIQHIRTAMDMPDTLADSSSNNNSTQGRSPRPDRDAFLRRLEERQRQRQIQQEDNDEGNGGPPGAEGTPEVPGGGDGTASAAAAGVGADGRKSDQKRPAPSTPAGAAAAAVAASTPTSGPRKSGIPPPRGTAAAPVAASTPTSAPRKSGIPPPRASSSPSAGTMKHAKERYEALRQSKDTEDLPSLAEAAGNGTISPARKGSDEDETEKKMAMAADMSTPAVVQSEAAAKGSANSCKNALEAPSVQERSVVPASATAESITAIRKDLPVVDRNEAMEVQQPIETDANDAATPLILSYLSECGISLTADLGIFVAANTVTGPAGPQFTQRLEEAFDPASLQALLDMSRKRKGDHVVLAGEEGSGDGKENSLAGAHTYMKRVKEMFAEQPSVYDEFVALMLDLENDKIDIHTVASKV